MYKPGFEIEFSDERLITPSGLSIIGGMLGKSNFIKRCNRIPVDKKRSEPQIKNGDIMLTYIGLLCQGKTEYDTVHEMQDDPDFYKTALGITRRIPSAETLCQRMDDIGSSLRPQILEANIDMFHIHQMGPSALTSGEVPVDIDVTPFDNSKTRKASLVLIKGLMAMRRLWLISGRRAILLTQNCGRGDSTAKKGHRDF